MGSSLLVTLAAMAVFVQMVIHGKLWKTFWQEHDSLPPDTLSLDRYQQHRQTANTLNLIDIGIFMYDMILSNHTTMGGAKGHRHSYLHSEGICTTGSCCQVTRTPSVPGSPPAPRHRLWSCVCYPWLGESPYGHVVAHLSYCLNSVLVHNVLSGSTTVQTTEYQFESLNWIHGAFILEVLPGLHSSQSQVRSCCVSDWLHQIFTHWYLYKSSIQT